MIYSIGYSKWTVDQLLKVMAGRSVDLLVDLRSVPFGRFNPPFNRTNLQRILGTATSGRAMSWVASSARSRMKASTGWWRLPKIGRSS